MEKALNSAMVEERSAEIVSRKNEIVDEINAKKEEFESSDTEKREELLNDVENLTNEADKLDEEMEALEEQRSTLKAQEERMSLAKNLEKTVIEERNSKQMENIDFRSTPEYAKAWRSAYMNGDSTQLRTLFSENVTGGKTGTAPIPTYLQGRVEASWQRLSILNEVSISNIKGILAIPVESSVSGAEIHLEGADAPAEETMTLGKVLLDPVYIKKWLKVSDYVENLSDEEFMNYIADEIVYQINLKAETYAVTKAASSNLAVSVSTNVGFNAINSALAELVEAVDPVVIMNRKTFFNDFMGLTDLQQRPIYQIAADNAGRPQYYLNGVRVLFSNAFDSFDVTTTGNAYALVGDLKAVRVNFPNGRIPEIVYDPYTEAQANISKYVGKLLMAADLVRPNAVAVLKKTA